jgi:hypothetical protein
MNKASRFQRTLLYCKENESALLNALGPGPAEYPTHLVEKARFGEKHKYTMPKVSTSTPIFFFTFFFPFPIDGPTHFATQPAGEEGSDILLLAVVAPGDCG